MATIRFQNFSTLNSINLIQCAVVTQCMYYYMYTWMRQFIWYYSVLGRKLLKLISILNVKVFENLENGDDVRHIMYSLLSSYSMLHAPLNHKRWSSVRWSHHSCSTFVTFHTALQNFNRNNGQKIIIEASCANYELR